MVKNRENMVGNLNIYKIKYNKYVFKTRKIVCVVRIVKLKVQSNFYGTILIVIHLVNKD